MSWLSTRATSPILLESCPIQYVSDPYPKFGDLTNQNVQILTLTFAEQTNKFVRSIESRWIPESIKEEL